ncbi:MAG: ABC transporter permease [Rhodospirillales bacterium]
MALSFSDRMQAASDREAPNRAELRRAGERENRGLLSLTSPSFLLLGVILYLPIGWLFWLSLLDKNNQFTWENYDRLFDPLYIKTFTTTFEISVIVTGLCILLGYPLAYLLTQLPRRAAGLCMIAVLLPFWTSLLVRTYAWLVILQRKGLVNTWLQDWGIIDAPLRLVHNQTGTIIGMTQIMLPFMILPLYAAMKTIPRDYMRAASNCGASPIKAFWQVFFPLSLPGLAAGFTLVFVLCLGFYVTPVLLGGGRVQMWAMRIETNVAVYFNWGAASSLGVALLAVTLVILYLANRLFGINKIYGR